MLHMNVDPFLISTVAVGVVAAWQWAKVENLKRVASFHRSWGTRMAMERDRMWCDLAHYETRERARRAHLKTIGARGKASQAATAKVRHERAAQDAEAARQRTIDSFKAAPLRSREAVVEGVIEARRARQKSGLHSGKD